MQGVGGKLELTPAYRLPREASWAVCGRTQIYTDPNVHEVFVVICIQSLAPSVAQEGVPGQWEWTGVATTL